MRKRDLHSKNRNMFQQFLIEQIINILNNEQQHASVTFREDPHSSSAWCVPFPESPGVNSQAELVGLTPGTAIRSVGSGMKIETVGLTFKCDLKFSICV
jgi:hypothetical protein